MYLDIITSIPRLWTRNQRRNINEVSIEHKRGHDKPARPQRANPSAPGTLEEDSCSRVRPHFAMASQLCSIGLGQVYRRPSHGTARSPSFYPETKEKQKKRKTKYMSPYLLQPQTINPGNQKSRHIHQDRSGDRHNTVGCTIPFDLGICFLRGLSTLGGIRFMAVPEIHHLGPVSAGEILPYPGGQARSGVIVRSGFIQKYILAFLAPYFG